MRCSSNFKGLHRPAELKKEQKWLRRKPALQTWPSAWSRPQEQKKAKVNNRVSEKIWPETYTADRVDRRSFAKFLGEVDQPIVLSDVEAYEAAHGNPFDWNLKEVSEALGPLLHEGCKGSTGVKLKVQHLAGGSVLVPGQIHEGFHVAAHHDHEP